jgi:peptidoglycan/LPS O-acetylase OafA/YrhL
MSREYRTDIDGLRAIAVALVVLFHSGLCFDGGFVGVDVFFVISGFLIVGIINRELIANEFSLVVFWTRRCRRILPALTVMVASVVVVGAILLLPHDFKELGQATIAQAIGLANFYYFRESGYFADAAEAKPLLHTWSLAVEEQFYVVIPLLLLLLRNRKQRDRLILLVLIFTGSLSWCVLTTARYPQASFFLLPARAWELALGGALAFPLFQHFHKPIVASGLGTIGLTLVAYSAVCFNESTVFPGAAALMPCFGAALLIYSGQSSHSLVARLLSLQPFVLVGKISYSFYLWHWPFFAYANYTGGELSVARALLLLIASFVLAILSWKYVEEPFRCGDRWRKPSTVFTCSAIAVAATLLVGVGLHIGNGIPQRFEDEVNQIANARSARSPLSKMHHDQPLSRLRERKPAKIGNPQAVPRIFVVGDSHADAVMPAVEAALTDAGLAAYCATQSATLPLFVSADLEQASSKASFMDLVRQFLEQDPNVTDVVFIGRWLKYPQDELLQRLQQTTLWCDEKSKTAWIVSQVPEPTGNVPRQLALATHWGLDAAYLSINRTDYEQQARQFKGALLQCTDRGSIQVVNLNDHFFDTNGLSIVQSESRPLFWDDDHLSTFGATFAVPVFQGLTKQIIARWDNQ